MRDLLLLKVTTCISLRCLFFSLVVSVSSFYPGGKLKNVQSVGTSDVPVIPQEVSGEEEEEERDSKFHLLLKRKVKPVPGGSTVAAEEEHLGELIQPTPLAQPLSLAVSKLKSVSDDSELIEAGVSSLLVIIPSLFIIHKFVSCFLFDLFFFISSPHAVSSGSAHPQF